MQHDKNTSDARMTRVRLYYVGLYFHSGFTTFIRDCLSQCDQQDRPTYRVIVSAPFEGGRTGGDAPTR